MDVNATSATTESHRSVVEQATQQPDIAGVVIAAFVMMYVILYAVFEYKQMTTSPRERTRQVTQWFLCLDSFSPPFDTFL